MKDFLKTTLAVICGTLIVSILGLVITMSIIGSLATLGSSTPTLPKEGGVLKIDLSTTTLAEQTSEGNPFSELSGSGSATIGIWDAVQAVNIAALDPAVKFIYLKTDNAASSLSCAEEFRKSLARFRELSGKPVVAYMESPSTGSYYLASVSDKIFMTSHPGSMISMTGVSSQMTFLGDLLKRLGVNMQLIRHGKYKSAGEMYTRSSSSPENREQYQRMVDSIWEQLRGEIARSRSLSEEAVDKALDNLSLCLPEDFVELGFADELLTRGQLEDRLATLAVAEKIDDVKMIPFADYVSVKVKEGRATKKIAVIYADGEIVDGIENQEVAGDRFAQIISSVRKDSTVKAVVLRVNSPGGSVLASEKIKSELDAFEGVKPLVASYGSYAASGGYWISNKCDKIFSDATTLTGSIGVFGLVPDFSKTASDVLHVGIETVNSNRHGDIYSGMRPFDKEEYAYMERSIEQIYDRFTDIVSEGRGIPKETVDAIGQGRVWTGADALKINLVDQIGTLEDAINYAAICAGDPELDNWCVKGYPRPQTQMEIILDALGQDSGSASLKGRLLRAGEAAGLVDIASASRAAGFGAGSVAGASAAGSVAGRADGFGAGSVVGHAAGFGAGSVVGSVAGAVERLGKPGVFARMDSQVEIR